MRASKNNDKQRALLPLLFTLSLTFLAGAVSADFSIHEARVRPTAAGLRLDASLDLQLSEPAREALNKGIPLDVVIDVRLYEHRPIWWDPEVARWELRRRVLYHALSRQYVVSAPEEEDAHPESFESLDEAMRYMGTIEDRLLVFTDKVDFARDNRVWLRASLDIESLPAPLRPVAYTSSAWRLQSGWKRWKIED